MSTVVIDIIKIIYLKECSLPVEFFKFYFYS